MQNTQFHMFDFWRALVSRAMFEGMSHSAPSFPSPGFTNVATIIAAGVGLILVVVFYVLGAAILIIMGTLSIFNSTIQNKFRDATLNMAQVAPVVGIIAGVGVVLVLVGTLKLE